MSMLAGLGRGLQGFSNLLGEHEKMNRAEQQRQVEWERQQHLEDLRHRRGMEMQKSTQDFTADQNLQQRNLTQQQIDQTGKYQDAQLGIAEGTYQMQLEKHQGEQLFWTPDGQPVTREQLKGMSEEDKKGLITDDQNKLNFQMNVLRQTEELKQNMSKQERDQIVSEMKESGAFEDLSPEAQRMLEMSVRSKEAAAVYSSMLEAQAKTGVKMSDQVDILKELNDVPVTKENLEYVNSLRARVGLGKLEVGEEPVPGFIKGVLFGVTEEKIRPAGGQLQGPGATATSPDAKAKADAYVTGNAEGTGMGATVAAGAKNVGGAIAAVGGRGMDPESPQVIEREIKGTPEYKEATKNMTKVAEANYLANKVQEEVVLRAVGPQRPSETPEGYQQRLGEAMDKAGIRYRGAGK